MGLIDKIWYQVAKALVRIFITVCFHPEIEGADNYKKITGPYIMYANHLSQLDPVLLAWMNLPRRTSFFGKSELMRRPLTRWALTRLGCIPVNRGTADIKAIREAIQAIGRGEVFSIFPEGTRNRELDGKIKQFHEGVAFVALRAKVPVLPVFLKNEHGFRLFHRAQIVVGKPVHMQDLYESGKTNSQSIEIAMERLSGAFIELKNMI
jgi:1-acyl-sn-glycerol-3-phosphate acyltransferase